MIPAATILAALLVVCAAQYAYYRNQRVRQIGSANLLRTGIKVEIEHAGKSLKSWHASLQTLIKNDEKPHTLTFEAIPVFVFSSVQRDFHFFPESLIDPLLRFHESERRLSVVLNDLRSDNFMELSKIRKGRYIDIIGVIISDYFDSGNSAVKTLDWFIEKRLRTSVVDDIFTDSWLKWKYSSDDK